MKTLLGFMLAGAVLFGFVWYEQGENPLDSFMEKSPTKNLDVAQDAADIYRSATDKRLQEEFGENW